MGLASLLMMTMLFHWAASEWQTEGCPEPCICHEVWVETLEAQLNAVDCAGRETTPSANLLNVYRAGSQPLKFHDIDTSSSCTSVVVQSFYQYLHASAARCADSNVFYHSLTFLERDLTTIGELPLGAQALILTGNRIRLDTIEGNLSDIQYLDLSSNELKLHKVDKLRQLFTRLTSLKALDLSDNYLESLMSSMFNDLELLESLSMNGNAVVYIERNTFQPLVGMRNLELADNHLTEINNNWFANGGDSLRTLDLRKNQISSVRKNDLMSLAHLEKLDLSWNQIVSIHVQAFEETRIEELLLGNNQLTSFPASQIRVLEKIVILNVDNNPIARLEAEEISGHTYLRQLSLSNMPLMSEIGPSTFVDLPNLKKVELYQNKELKYIDKNAFVNCPEVEFLYAHSNSLRGLDSSLLSAVMKLRVLSIYNNPLHCNCLVHWMLSSNLTLIDGDKVVCHTPHLHKNSLLSTLTAEQLMSDCLPLVVNDDLKATIEFGSDLQVECHAIGAHTISWTGPIHDAGAMKSPAMQHNGSSLTILGVKHADQGLYTCVATSEFGSDSQAMYVQVIHSEVDLQAVLVSQTFTTLSWTDTSDTVYLTFANATTGKTVEILVPASITSYSLESLESDTTYVVCLLYHNKKEHSCVTVETLPIARNDVSGTQKPTQSSDGYALELFVTILVVVIAIVIVGVVSFVACKKFRRYQKSRVMYKRHIDEHLLDNSSQIKLNQFSCYNPTTAPLFNIDDVA